MSRLFQLGEDGFLHILSWLDMRSIGFLDIAVGNKEERSLWLHSLNMMDSKAVDKCKHSRSSIRWLIVRGAKHSHLASNHQITDEIFGGVGNLPTQNRDSVKRGVLTLLRSFGNYILRNRRIKHRNHCIRMQGNPHLKSISLDDCDISDVGLSIIAQCCPNLTSIDLRRTFYKMKIEHISDIGVTAIAEGCPHLVSISLCYITGLSDVGMAAIGRGCPYLTSFDLHYSRNVSDIGLSAIALHCPNLTSITICDLSYITDIGVKAIAKGCHHLTSINLAKCYKISDIGVSALAEGCHRLISINLAECYKISDIGLLNIAQCCPNLKCIDLSRQSFNSPTYCISDIGVTAIAEGCPRLVSIYLCNCVNISDTTLSAIATHCPQLTFIDLQNCSAISDMGIVALADACPHLFSYPSFQYIILHMTIKRLNPPFVNADFYYRSLSR